MVGFIAGFVGCILLGEWAGRKLRKEQDNGTEDRGNL